jgi:hypothetical protein
MLQCSMKRVELPACQPISLCSATIRIPAVAKIAASPFPAPAFQRPAPKLPKLDLDALSAVQKTNLAAVQEAQAVLVDAAQAIAKVQHGYLEQALADAKAAVNGQAPRTPKAVLAEVKAAAEKAGATTRQVLDLAVTAQRRIGALVTQRAQASISESKALAA